MRRNVYPRLVGAKRMTVFKAEEEILNMKEIVDYLRAQPKPEA